MHTDALQALTAKELVVPIAVVLAVAVTAIAVTLGVAARRIEHRTPADEAEGVRG